MNKIVFLLFIGLFGLTTQSFGQSFATFSERPVMQLTPQNVYQHCKVRYKATQKSTIYLELKKGNEIVASGVHDVYKPSENVVQIPLQARNINKLTPGNNYSYNLYMYAGGRNDWTKKACRSAHVNKVQMGKGRVAKKQNQNVSNSLRSFFK